MLMVVREIYKQEVPNRTWPSTRSNTHTHASTTNKIAFCIRPPWSPLVTRLAPKVSPFCNGPMPPPFVRHLLCCWTRAQNKECSEVVLEWESHQLKKKQILSNLTDPVSLLPMCISMPRFSFFKAQSDGEILGVHIFAAAWQLREAWPFKTLVISGFAFCLSTLKLQTGMQLWVINWRLRWKWVREGAFWIGMD